jgi:hypothetical protein
MWKRIRAWWAIERATEELMHLDDRLLADIGLDRTELRQRIRAAEDDIPHSSHPEPDLCLLEVGRC